MARPRIGKTTLASGLAASVVLGLAGALPAQAISGGTPVTIGEQGYSAYIRVGTKTCSGVLVDQQWVLTATACFGSESRPRRGAPAERTVVTVGRTKLSYGGGEVGEVTHLEPSANRLLTMAKLADPVADLAPVPLPGAAGFAPEEPLTVTGYGALAQPGEDEDRLHTATFKLDTVSNETLTLGAATPAGAELCAGDVGGPVLRQRDGRLELGGIITRVTQRNCHGEIPLSERLAAARADNLTDWMTGLIVGGRENPAVTEGGIIELKNKITGSCFTGPHIEPCGNRRSRQEYELLDFGDRYALRNLYTKQCLRAPATGSADFANCDPAQNDQRWWFLPGRGGTVQLINQAHQKPLTLTDVSSIQNAVLRNGQPYDYQLWEITAKGKVRTDLPQQGSLKAVNPGLDDHYLRHARGEGWLNLINASSPDLDKADASFRLVPGLADPRCYSFEAGFIPGAFLRHANGRLRLDDNNSSELFKADATFCARTGLSNGTGVSFASFNFPDNYIRHINGEVWSAYKGGAQWYENPANFEPDSSWHVTPPLKP